MAFALVYTEEAIPKELHSSIRKEDHIMTPHEQDSSVSQRVEPNLFELSNTEIHITYASSSFPGQPQLHYHTDTTVLSFQGQDIRVEQSELGSLVTVSLVRTVDTGYTSLTIVVPQVNLAGSTQQNVSTVAIITRHLFSILPHTGAQNLYSVQKVDGIARLVEF